MPEKREFDPKLEGELRINNAYNSASSWLDTIETHMEADGTMPELPSHKQEKIDTAFEASAEELEKFFEAYDQFPELAENDMYKAWAEGLEKRAAAAKIEYHRKDRTEAA